MSYVGKGEQGRAQAEGDALFAWTCATNCLLYEDDPGPAQLNIGSATEPAWVSRSDAWRDAYAHTLIEQVDADHGRLLAAAQICRAERDAGTEGFRRAHRRALDLYELAAGIVAEAGAETDDTARRRLLAGTRHTNMMIGLGVIPGVAEHSTDRLNRDLDTIDGKD